MNKGSRVNITRAKNTDGRYGEGVTSCDGCPRFPVNATRERCRQHARVSGHTVRYVVIDTTTYQPKEQT